MKFVDDYPTCDETYITLRIYCGEISPDVVTEILGIKASDKIYKGKTVNGRKRPAILNGWFLTSEGKVDSLDSRAHLHWLFRLIDGKESPLNQVTKLVDNVYISCYWRSKSGHGGPKLDTEQMEKLVKYGLNIEYDVYI
ncbi:DUF4279 domain-containing protein [Microbulbifer sp. TRSA001]|uniref:DUF4279 domain-containing protein n=1 Tax=unclassified Microbulbifer TaxID=2619833 RepID=UPI0024AD6689|nr:DUF4279 domain-containing protein [Microbulbifer sp. VAAF005]WHI45930.1 DUF4279 domain-containing protein [Microbulbifer sp. VAAF005]